MLITLFSDEIVVDGSRYRLVGDTGESGWVYYEAKHGGDEWRRNQCRRETWDNFARRYGNRVDAV